MSNAYGTVPLDLTGTRLTAVKDYSEDLTTDEGVRCTGWDVYRITGKRQHRIASVAVYSNGTVLVQHGMASGAGSRDYDAQATLKDHLAAHYDVAPWSIYPYAA